MIQLNLLKLEKIIFNNQKEGIVFLLIEVEVIVFCVVVVCSKIKHFHKLVNEISRRNRSRSVQENLSRIFQSCVILDVPQEFVDKMNF